MCKCHQYIYGFCKQHQAKPGTGWAQHLTVKPFNHTRKRQHLQIVSPRIDFVCRILEAAANETPQLIAPEKGYNYCNTPCTDYGAQTAALLARQTLGDEDRPHTIEPRHRTGYQNALRRLYQTLSSIIKSQKREKPDYRERYKNYSGSKRRHYELCAEEQDHHPLSDREHEIYHEQSGKWGELSDRPRVLLVQQVRSKGTPNIKAGTPLRLPICMEGGYRDYVEDALHHYCHKNGMNYIASGMNLRKRGQFLDSMCKEGDLLLSLDWSRFDGTLGWLAVDERLEFLRVMENLFGTDHSLRAVINSQNHCLVQGGPIKAKIFGNRGSGTAGTSAGNKCVVLAAISYCLGPAFGGRRGVKILCDGDDTIIVVPPHFRGENDRWIDSWVRRFRELGLETKVQQRIDYRTPDDLASLRFCRAGVIRTADGHLLCKEPLDAVKVMSNFRKHFRGPRFRDYLSTLSVGIAGCYSGVPILHCFGPLFNVGGKFDRELFDSSGFEYMMSHHAATSGTEVTQEARESFSATFKVTLDQQLQCEKAIMDEIPYFREALEAFLREDTIH